MNVLCNTPLLRCRFAKNEYQLHYNALGIFLIAIWLCSQSLYTDICVILLKNFRIKGLAFSLVTGFMWQVWLFGWSSFFWKFGLTAYILLYSNYLVKHCGFTTAQAAVQATIFGVTSIFGVLTMVTVAHLYKMNSMIFHTVLPLIYGSLMLAITISISAVSYASLMIEELCSLA